MLKVQYIKDRLSLHLSLMIHISPLRSQVELTKSLFMSMYLQNTVKQRIKADEAEHNSSVLCSSQGGCHIKHTVHSQSSAKGCSACSSETVIVSCRGEKYIAPMGTAHRTCDAMRVMLLSEPSHRNPCRCAALLPRNGQLENEQAYKCKMMRE
jgi:hypothetical protein